MKKNKEYPSLQKSNGEQIPYTKDYRSNMSKDNQKRWDDNVKAFAKSMNEKILDELINMNPRVYDRQIGNYSIHKKQMNNKSNT